MREGVTVERKQLARAPTMNAQKVAYVTREEAVGKCNEKEDQGSPSLADAVDSIVCEERAASRTAG